MTTNSAYLSTANGSLGSQVDDGLRVGPVNSLPAPVNPLTNTVTTLFPGGVTFTGNPYNQWGRGLLLSAMNCYNIIPRGPGATGNVVGYLAPFAPTKAGYLTLSADNYVTTLNTSGNQSNYLQLDWPRALSVIVAGGNLGAAATITVFGKDAFGQQMQEAVTVQNAGIYQMRKAFYEITAPYYNGAASGGPTIQIQTTDTFGLPYVMKSVGAIANISWGLGNEFGVQTPLPAVGPIDGTSAAMVAGATTIATTATALPTTRSQIQYSENTNATAVGKWAISAFDAGTNFVITSSANTETSTVNWTLVPNNWAFGTAILVGGTVFVSAPSVQANSNIMLSRNVTGGTLGFLTTSTVALNGVSTIVPGVGFTINSVTVAGTALAVETSTVNWAIAQDLPAIATGTATLNGTTAVTIPCPSIQTGSIVQISYRTVGAGTLGSFIQVPVAGVIPNQSFTVVSQAATDTSTIYYQVFAPNAVFPIIESPLGTFTPADPTPATNTTGDVRGTYKPSTAADGFKQLHFNAYIYGFDNFINQQSYSTLSAGGTSANPLTRGLITFTDQFGQIQYFTGNHA